MKTLKIDDKFSIVYDDEMNDRPLYVERNGMRHTNMMNDTQNWVVCMFYALLEIQQKADAVAEANEKISEIRYTEHDAWDQWFPNDNI
jgi:hypothetical protein